jgi:hypothetical protein
MASAFLALHDRLSFAHLSGAHPQRLLWARTEQTLTRFKAAGVDAPALARQLRREGTQAFINSQSWTVRRPALRRAASSP